MTPRYYSKYLVKRSKFMWYMLLAYTNMRLYHASNHRKIWTLKYRYLQKITHFVLLFREGGLLKRSYKIIESSYHPFDCEVTLYMWCYNNPSNKIFMYRSTESLCDQHLTNDVTIWNYYPMICLTEQEECI